MVVTASPRATGAGVGILKQGGNAIDAAVAVGFALAVTYPSAGNIGGGGFMLIRSSEGEVSFLDFREKAPLKASRDMYLDSEGEVVEGSSTAGHLASGVPGTVAGLYQAHSRYGVLEWSRVIKPAIQLAENGFEVDRHLALKLEKLEKFRKKFPGLRVFLDKYGKAPAEGALFRQPELAATLRRISAEGRDGFYRGKTAGLIIEEMKSGNGLITGKDLESYSAVERKPVEGSYRNFTVISAPPPSSGGIILIEILNMLEGFCIGQAGFLSPRDIHYIVESERRAYADRARYLGDPDFCRVPAESLTSKYYAERLIESIGRRATPSEDVEDILQYHEHEETTHYSIIDRSGNAVAVTTTLNGSFGSKVVVEGGGFLMNNEMDDFSIKPGVPNMYGLVGDVANQIEPGKRMLSSMSPTMVLDRGEIYLVVGTPGGATIITTVAQIILNMIDYGMDPHQAVSAPRFHHQWLPDLVYHEDGAFDRKLMDELESMGYNLKNRSLIGDVQLIEIRDSRITGVPDPRGGGTAGSSSH